MYYRARYYDPTLGRFVSADAIVPEPGNPQSLNRYAYVKNNPLRYVDPSGHWFETALDIAGIAYDIYEIKRDGLNLVNGAALAVDVVCFAAPIATGGGMAVRAAAHADEAVDVVQAVDRAGDALRTTDAVDDVSDVLRASDNLDEVGAATIHRHGRSHFSIEINQSTGTLHTHQVTSFDGNTTQIVNAANVSPGEIASSSHPIKLDASAASDKQRMLLGAGNLGPYNKISNSCVSHVCDVLQAGGIGVPAPNGSAQLRYLLDLLE